MRDPEKHPWLYERDGDLNPTWLFVAVYLALGVAAVIMAMITRNPIAIGAALAFLGAIIMALLISALPRDKAKILANSRAPGEVARGITGGGDRTFGTSTQWFERDESELDPSQPLDPPDRGGLRQ